jgi:hypothetical protein
MGREGCPKLAVLVNGQALVSGRRLNEKHLFVRRHAWITLWRRSPDTPRDATDDSVHILLRTVPSEFRELLAGDDDDPPAGEGAKEEYQAVEADEAGDDDSAGMKARKGTRRRPRASEATVAPMRARPTEEEQINVSQ